MGDGKWECGDGKGGKGYVECNQGKLTREAIQEPYKEHKVNTREMQAPLCYIKDVQYGEDRAQDGQNEAQYGQV